MESNNKSYHSKMSNKCIFQIRIQQFTIQHKGCLQSNTIEKKNKHVCYMYLRPWPCKKLSPPLPCQYRPRSILKTLGAV